MGDKTELPKLKRSWIFTKIGVLLFATSIIVSFGWLVAHECWATQHPGEGGNLWGLAWAIVCYPIMGFFGCIALICFGYESGRNGKKGGNE